MSRIPMPHCNRSAIKITECLMCNSLSSHEINLDLGTLRELGHAHGGTGRFMAAKVLRIDRVQRLKMRQIGQINSGLRHMIEVTPGLTQDCLQVLEDAPHLS